MPGGRDRPLYLESVSGLWSNLILVNLFCGAFLSALLVGTPRPGEELQLRLVHLVIVDPFPPGALEPDGLHKAIWDEIQENTFTPPTDKPLMVVSYQAGEKVRGYVEPIAVGDPLPSVPLYLNATGRYVPCPLEVSYQATW